MREGGKHWPGERRVFTHTSMRTCHRTSVLFKSWEAKANSFDSKLSSSVVSVMCGVSSKYFTMAGSWAQHLVQQRCIFHWRESMQHGVFVKALHSLHVELIAAQVKVLIREDICHIRQHGRLMATAKEKRRESKKRCSSRSRRSRRRRRKHYIQNYNDSDEYMLGSVFMRVRSPPYHGFIRHFTQWMQRIAIQGIHGVKVRGKPHVL